MKRASLTKVQANELATVLRDRRRKLGYTVRQLAAKADVNLATIVKLERGEILTPQPDTLQGMARGLRLRMSDLLAVAGWLPADELPALRPYLRAKYRELDDDAIADLARYTERRARKHGNGGPTGREDEDPE